MGGDLATSLLEIATDPGQVAVLYQLLGEFCHQFRNPLNGLKLSLYLARRAAAGAVGSAWEDLERQYRDIELLIGQIQDFCRPIRLQPLRLTLDGLVDDRLPTWAGWFTTHGRRLEVCRPPEPAVGSFDPTRLILGLDALAAWRADAGPPGTAVQVSWGAEPGHLRLVWIEPECEKGEHGATSGGNSPECARLALPVVARVMAAHGGSLEIVHDRHGLSFRMQWPSDHAAMA